MKSGKSVIVSQTPVPPVTVALMPGYEFYPLWGNDDHPSLPSDGTPTESPRSTWFPPKHGFPSRFVFFFVSGDYRQNWACSPLPPKWKTMAETAYPACSLEVLLEIDHFPVYAYTLLIRWTSYVVVFENRHLGRSPLLLVFYLCLTLTTIFGRFSCNGPQCGKTCS